MRGTQRATRGASAGRCERSWPAGRDPRTATLAVLGGTPAFAEPIHVGRPSVTRPQRVLERISEALDRRVLTNSGPLVRQFEDAIAQTANVRHCVAMCNATIAMQILVRALGLRDEVILPSFTFAATAHVLRWAGITPVFCDIDYETGNIDPVHARKLITARTSGIVGVHLWGRPAPVDELVGLAADHGLRLYFDSAHGIGSEYGGRPIGGFGDAEVFSFHATKMVNAFEGGAVVTDDAELAEQVRWMHNHGITGFDTAGMLGTNGKMTEACAAMGLTSLEDIDELIALNRARHERYRAGLAGVPGIRLRDPAISERVNYQSVVIEVDPQAAGLHRDELSAALHAENVLARRYFHPGCHRLEPYLSDQRRHVPIPLPNTETLSERVLVLPTGTAVDANQVDQICVLIDRVIQHAPAVSARVRRA